MRAGHPRGDDPADDQLREPDPSSTSTTSNEARAAEARGPSRTRWASAATTAASCWDEASRPSAAPPGRAARPAASSVAPVASGYERSLASLSRNDHRSPTTSNIPPSPPKARALPFIAVITGDEESNAAAPRRVVLVLVPAPASDPVRPAACPRSRAGASSAHVPGELIVRFRSGDGVGADRRRCRPARAPPAASASA